MKLEAHQIEERVVELERRCRDEGLPVTPQRLAIFRCLLRSERHPDAEELYSDVRLQFPNLSLATVYKNLDVFEKLGVIRELTPLHETARFDANLEHHHHLICTNCKSVSDLHDRALDSIKVPKAHVAGFRVTKVHVQIEGLCAACTRSADA